jgi:dTDP-glucose pyrophosphorylase
MTEPSAGWEKTLLGPRATVREAIQSLNRSSMQIVLVVDSRRRLLGTVTDGDIRRGFLHGRNLDSHVVQVMNRRPLTTGISTIGKKTRDLMKRLKILQLPIIDSQKKIYGLHLWDEDNKPQNLPNNVVVMAGGFGKRLGHLTKKMPKPLLPIKGRPMLSLVIEKIKEEGFRKVLICVFYKKNQIMTYLGDGTRHGVEINYLQESRPLGTAGGLANVPPQKLPILVLNADITYNFSLRDFLDYHYKENADVSVAVKAETQKIEYGLIKTKKNKIVAIEEKPSFQMLLNAGAYWLSPKILKKIKPNEPCDMPIFLARLIREKLNIIAYPVHETWQDLGTVASYEKANR